MKSAVSVLRSLTRIFLIYLGWRRKTTTELRDFMDIASTAGLIDARTTSMMEGTIQVGETRVRDIMIPRSQMVMLDRQTSLEDALDMIVRHGHSRYPVMGNGQKVFGVVLAKDLLHCFQESDEDDREDKPFVIQDHARPAVFVPESKRLSTLLEDFKKSRNHMAVAVDEYGGVSGLITIEDVVEQIVGDIADEHDIEATEYIRRHGESWLVRGMTPISDFNDHFATDIDEEGTVAGLVIRQLGYLPKNGERAEVQGFLITVTRADRRRVHQLEVIPKSRV